MILVLREYVGGMFFTVMLFFSLVIALVIAPHQIIKEAKRDEFP